MNHNRHIVNIGKNKRKIRVITTYVLPRFKMKLLKVLLPNFIQNTPKRIPRMYEGKLITLKRYGSKGSKEKIVERISTPYEIFKFGMEMADKMYRPTKETKE